ncbi:MAG: Gfo/Idh/MocA family oxidoreductase, partial [Proteobacteria bacterium]|nr:Gfo/Idh/MocA family oxidoreductase [Pseudomonadota bacterium]
MINLAVVGLGYWGRRHVTSALGSGRFKVVRAVDVDPDPSMQEFADAHGIALSAALDDVLEAPDVEALTLATPHSLHTEQIVRASQAGKHIYTEKPFALSKADAERSVAACEKAGIVLALGHDQRFYPSVIEMKDLIEAGELGTLLHVEANLSHDAHQKAHYARIAAEQKKPEVNQAASGYAATRKPRAWRRDPKEAPTGPLVHFGIHRVDSFIHLLGEVDWVFANCAERTLDPGVTDTISVTMKFKSGATGYLGCSLSTPLNSRLQVFGSAGWAEARGPLDSMEYTQCSLKSLTVVSGDEHRTGEFEPVDSVQKCFEGFADAIEGTAPFIISTDQMIHNAAFME